MPRDKWALKDDAVPRLFPNCPSYLSKPTRKRKAPARRLSPAKSKRRKGQGTASHVALLARINALERQLTMAKAKARVKEREHKKLMLHLSSYINEDQFTSLHRSPGGTVWSKEILTKALKIRLSCGSRGYDMVKELGQPLPSQRTLQRHIEHCKFRPGLLVNCMTEYERHACLMIDEMQITPSLVYDPSADAVLGRPTIPLADGSLPTDTLATHGLVFMLGGDTTR
ncbi:hypothetical protein HPB51_027960 [Rhipicephalus microplus]|uniref:Transposable element P transposase-like RNase H domain-containing protein n=1 Tax=Rhipicephalus microplus TaxID=6941 RepID=A0A9J6CYA9_RHIMP|nr:hypothetical protein HPB51_027960 [Rhipicephalus microplus]